MKTIFSQKFNATGYATKAILDAINESSAVWFTFNVENKGSLVFASSFKKSDDVEREIKLALEFANYDFIHGKKNNVLILFER